MPENLNFVRKKAQSLVIYKMGRTESVVKTKTRRNKLTGINHVSSRKLQFCKKRNRRKQDIEIFVKIFITYLMPLEDKQM